VLWLPGVWTYSLLGDRAVGQSIFARQMLQRVRRIERAAQARLPQRLAGWRRRLALVAVIQHAHLAAAHRFLRHARPFGDGRRVGRAGHGKGHDLVQAPVMQIQDGRHHHQRRGGKHLVMQRLAGALHLGRQGAVFLRMPHRMFEHLAAPVQIAPLAAYAAHRGYRQAFPVIVIVAPALLAVRMHHGRLRQGLEPGLDAGALRRRGLRLQARIVQRQPAQGPLAHVICLLAGHPAQHGALVRPAVQPRQAASRIALPVGVPGQLAEKVLDRPGAGDVTRAQQRVDHRMVRVRIIAVGVDLGSGRRRHAAGLRRRGGQEQNKRDKYFIAMCRGEGNLLTQVAQKRACMHAQI
jgi:hypothetical protein